MNITLYHGEPNGPSFTVLAALKEAKVDAKLNYIDLTRAERHASSIPNSIETEMSVEGEGPVLVVDGEAMADSVFIARFIDSVGDGTSLSPEDSYERWDMMTFCRHIIERVAPAAALLGTKETLTKGLALLSDADFDALISNIVSDDLKERWVDVRKGNFSDEQVEDSKQKIHSVVSTIEEKLADKEWLMGSFSIADLETYAWLAGMVNIVPTAFDNKPNTVAWLARVKARPSVQDVLSNAKTQQPQDVWAPGPEVNRWG